MRRPLDIVVLALLFSPSLAWAHVRITSPTPRSTTQLKERHCGSTGSARANVQVFAPGAALHLTWDEYIGHPGWYRISFQENGATFEIPPASNGPTGTGNPSNFPTEDLTGMTDPASGSLIIADRIADGTLSYDFTLPEVECDDCTLQLIQLMTDKPPYSIATTSNDIYYACVDLVLSGDAPDAGPGGGDPDAGPADPDAGDPAAPDAGGPGTASSGCNAAGGAPGLVAALALLGLRRRRRALPSTPAP